MESLLHEPAFWTIVLFIIPLLIRVPIAVALGSATIFVVWNWDMGYQMLSYSFFAGIAKFPLLAIPFFILAGVIMEKAGIAERIITLIKQLVGDMTGGLAVATTLPPSKPPPPPPPGPRTGHHPSEHFIVYGDIMQQSVGPSSPRASFPASSSQASSASRSTSSAERGYKGLPRGNASVVLRSVRDAFWGLFTPVIILGGIYGGIFTPTEAAAVAVFYGLFVGIFVYKTLTPRIMYDILQETVAGTSVVMIVVTCAGLYSWLGSTVGLIDKVAAVLLGISENPVVILLMINIILLFAGMLLDAISIFYVFLPILAPIIVIFGWDPIWFGIMMTVNMAIGQVTPPVAVNLFVGARISGLTMEQISRPAIPLIIAFLIALVVITAFPGITLFLPRLLGMM
ncbi:TRAP transporter large permease [Aminivibrio sp.]